MVERSNTHSFEQKIDRRDSRVPWCVNYIYIFLLSNLMARIDQYTGSDIGLMKTGSEEMSSMTLTDLLGARERFFMDANLQSIKGSSSTFLALAR